MNLTPTQRRVLEFIASRIVSAGSPPTRAEIAEHFGWKSHNAAEAHVHWLERKGMVTVVRGTARGLRLTDKARALLGERVASPLPTASGAPDLVRLPVFDMRFPVGLPQGRKA